MKAFITLLLTATLLAGCFGHDHSATSVNVPPIASLSAAPPILHDAFNVPVRNFASYDFGRSHDPAEVSILMDRDHAEQTVTDIRHALAPGLFAYIGTTRWLGDEKHVEVEVVVFSGKDQFDIVRTARTDASAYKLYNADLVKHLQDYDQKYGIDIFQAEGDGIQFHLKKLPDDLDDFVKDVYEFCPDVVDQGFGSLQALKEDIQRTSTLRLWWD